MSSFTASPLMDWVDTHADRLVQEWRECCRIPSVSADGAAAVGELAAWLSERAAPLFDDWRAPRTSDGAPVLIGRIDGSGPGRLLLYTHYDVVPAGEGWTGDPFAAERRDGAVFARGCGDDKADVMARLHALQAWAAVHGRPPFSVIWCSEGMEEVGSPGLAEILDTHRDALAADWCLWESYYRSVDEHAATIGYGSRGVLTVELSVALLDADAHSGLAAVYRSSAILLARAVAALTDDHGRVLIPGFDEDLVSLPEPPGVLDGPAPVGSDVDPTALWTTDPAQQTRRWLYEPTLNVAALHAGPAGGDHDATVLPARARARIDIRLMPDQDPARIRQRLEQWLRARGLGEVAVRTINAIPPARSSLDSPLADAVRGAATELMDGAAPVEHPVVPGSGPLHLFTERMDVSAVMPPGTIRPDGGMHGPDENVRCAHYLDCIKLTLSTLERLADDPRVRGAAVAGEV